MSSISCRVVRKHLDALVDGELDTNIQVQFEAHLASCPLCREQLAFSRTIKRAVKDALGNVNAPDRLRYRVLEALEAESTVSAETDSRSFEPAGQVRHRRGLGLDVRRARYAIPAAAAAMLAVALSAPTDDGRADDAAIAATSVPLFEDVARRHASLHPAEIAGPPQQVVGWFRGKLEFPVRPVVFDRDDVRLVGARLSNVRERDAAVFYYDARGRRVTVMVFEPAKRRTDGQTAWVGAQRVNVRGRELWYRQVRGYTIPVVEHDGLTYAFTGDLDSQQMLLLAASARVLP
jgi:anti-sigma factor (TIGR02949 family)